MQIDLNGLSFDTPHVSFHLWSPWRASALEHRMFETIKALPRVETQPGPDEWVAHILEPKLWKQALQGLARVLKGWQEEADPALERRSWRWLLEGDTDADGYDHSGQPASLWGFVRVSLERGGVGEFDKGEDLDLEGFGLQIWGSRRGD